jgi:BASS family bile acid:Na+ symporter
VTGIVTLAGTITVFTIMVSLGLGTRIGDVRAELARPWLLLRALVAVLVAVPLVAIAVARALDLDWAAQVGIVLMAIAPAAPVGLRRSLGAGSHRGFAASLQMSAALLAVVTMPLAIALLNPLYSGRASIAPSAIAGQVFVMQLLPLGIGMAARWAAEGLADRIGPAVTRAGNVMLILFLAVLLVMIWRDLLGAAPRNIVAIVLITALALLIGHAAGAPAADTRKATAMACAARNAGLVLLVASLNTPRPDVIATVMAYVVWSAVAVTIYLAIVARISAGRQGSSTSTGRPG